MANIDKSVGSKLWAFDRFRSSALPKLLDDILKYERVGFSEDECNQVRKTLDKILNLCSEIPDKSFFKKSIYSRLLEFKELYIKWNEVKGSDKKSIADRNKILEKLRSKRSQLAKTVRKNSFILENELDLNLLKSIYEALGDLAKALPKIFTNLSKAVSSFFKKLFGQ